MKPEIYVSINSVWKDSVFYTQTTLLFESFKRAGAIVCMGDELLNISPNADDKLIIYGGFETADIKAKMELFEPDNRWLYVVDEQVGQDPYPYYRSLSYMRDVLKTRNIIVTYQNAGHLDLLKRAGANYRIMPQCVEEIRPLTSKQGDILISGQLDPVFFDVTATAKSFYATRTRLAVLLRRFVSIHTTLLQHPGFEKSTAWHDKIGKGYLETLDNFKMGVVCRAGNNDRFVGKYVEMGASHVLPVGDCPTYMPDSMKRAMINVEGMTDQQALQEIVRVLNSPQELQQRADVFSAEVNRRYLSVPNLQRLIMELAC